MDKERGKFLSVFTSAELDVENKHGRTGISLSDPLEDRTKGWSTFSICNRLALSRLISEIYESMEIYASYGGQNLHPLPTFEPSFEKALNGFMRSRGLRTDYSVFRRLFHGLRCFVPSFPPPPHFNVYLSILAGKFSTGSRIELIPQCWSKFFWIACQATSWMKY